MTFKDLRKIVAKSNNQQQQQTTLFSSRVWDKPFWIWNIEEHKVADRNFDELAHLRNTEATMD